LSGEGAARPGHVIARVLLRLPNTGKVQLDGGVVTYKSGSPTLDVGQHVIVSAYLNLYVGAWVPFGIFEVRAGQIVGLDPWGKNLKYDSVDAFASALANLPPTAGR
jgi:hypothetical protein